MNVYRATTYFNEKVFTYTAGRLPWRRITDFGKIRLIGAQKYNTKNIVPHYITLPARKPPNTSMEIILTISCKKYLKEYNKHNI